MVYPVPPDPAVETYPDGRGRSAAIDSARQTRDNPTLPVLPSLSLSAIQTRSTIVPEHLLLSRGADVVAGTGDTQDTGKGN